MARRLSGPPRRPRNPVAKAVRTPQSRQRIVPDKRRNWLDRQQQIDAELAEREGDGETAEIVDGENETG